MRAEATPRLERGVRPAAAVAERTDPLLERIASVLGRRTGTDLSGYRRSTLGRRVRNRMLTVGATSMAEYLALLERSNDEPAQLLARVTIKVSRFYRNSRTFDLLRHVVVPELCAGGRAPRVWSAGCAGGEEPYTLAMLLDEAGAAATVEATDIDSLALAAAERGEYRDCLLDELPAELRAAYLRPGGKDDVVRVAPELRRRVRFSRHDLACALTPPGGARFDLICCRNVLIYLESPAQQRVFSLLCQALLPGGYLSLGEAEWPSVPLASQLEVIDRPGRLFRRRLADGWDPRLELAGVGP